MQSTADEAHFLNNFRTGVQPFTNTGARLLSANKKFVHFKVSIPLSAMSRTICSETGRRAASAVQQL
jgi:hypothetical protein